MCMSLSVHLKPLQCCMSNYVSIKLEKRTILKNDRDKRISWQG